MNYIIIILSIMARDNSCATVFKGTSHLGQYLRTKSIFAFLTYFHKCTVHVCCDQVCAVPSPSGQEPPELDPGPGLLPHPLLWRTGRLCR